MVRWSNGPMVKTPLLSQRSLWCLKERDVYVWSKVMEEESLGRKSIFLINVFLSCSCVKQKWLPRWLLFFDPKAPSFLVKLWSSHSGFSFISSQRSYKESKRKEVVSWWWFSLFVMILPWIYKLVSRSLALFQTNSSRESRGNIPDHNSSDIMAS